MLVTAIIMMTMLETSSGGVGEGGASEEGGVAEASEAGDSSPIPGVEPLLQSRRSWPLEETCSVSPTRRRKNTTRMRKWLTLSRGQRITSKIGKCFIPRRANKDSVKLNPRRIIDGSAGRSFRERQEMRRIWMILLSSRVQITAQSERQHTQMILKAKRSQ